MIATWIEQRRSDALIHVAPLTWSECAEWHFDTGGLRHRSGGFFSIQGITLNPSFQSHYPACMPIIDQPEVGIIAFLVTQGADGPHWLLQAKGEPGSEGFVQVGPTVQATRSNYLRRHGGQETAYIEYVTGRPEAYLSWTRQSEQGTRFLGKYNANIVCEIDEEIAPHNRDWLWVDCGALRAALARDYTVNTDARSVLVCTDWSYLCEDRLPFSADRAASGTGAADGGWGSASSRKSLATSYAEYAFTVAQVKAWLKQHRQPFRLNFTRVALEDMPGWGITDNAILPRPGIADFEVRIYQVEAPRREISKWQQPLVCNTKTERYCLFLARLDGIVKICLTLSDEPGFDGQAQLGPTWQEDRSNPCWVRNCIEQDLFDPIVNVLQSDEGGRFMSSRGRYELVEIDPQHINLSSKKCLWLSLGEVQRICLTVGLVTNEARSAISLILSLL